MKKLRFLRSLSLASVSGMAMSVAAFAQSAQPPSEVVAETVTVTGSRVISDVANSPTPLTVVSADQLLTTTPTNIADGLNKMPVFAGSNSEANRSSGAGKPGIT